jgi:hypothetical protein
MLQKRGVADVRLRGLAHRAPAVRVGEGQRAVGRRGGADAPHIGRPQPAPAFVVFDHLDGIAAVHVEAALNVAQDVRLRGVAQVTRQIHQRLRHRDAVDRCGGDQRRQAHRPPDQPRTRGAEREADRDADQDVGHVFTSAGRLLTSRMPAATVTTAMINRVVIASPSNAEPSRSPNTGVSKVNDANRVAG